MPEIGHYLERRIGERLQWYDKRARQAKRAHRALEYLSVFGSVSLVLLLHVNEIPRLGLAGIAAVVTLALAVEKIGKYGELWMAYRLTSEALEAEVELYKNGAGPYREGSDQDKRLVERVEQLLSKEAFDWARLIESRGGSSGSGPPVIGH